MRFGLTDAHICYIMERVKIFSFSKISEKSAFYILGGFHGKGKIGDLHRADDGLNEIETFHSTVSLTGKDITLGNAIDEDNYIGGGYVTTYYPEGVISAKEY